MRLSTRLLRQLLVALLLMVGQVASPLSATGNATAASSHRDRPSSLLAPSSMAAASAGTPAIEFLNSLGGDIPSAAIDGTLAYVIEGNTLAVVDVSNPAAPLLRGRVPTQARDDADVVVAGGHAYVTREQMLEIIDVSNPAAPRVVGSYKTSLSYIKTVQVVAQRAYLFSGDGFEVVDVGDPVNPRSLGKYDGTLEDMQVVGNLVYVLLRNQGLSILDMSDPVHPVVRGKFALSAYGDSFYPNLSVTNNRVYISVGGNTGLHLVTLDVTNPASPSLLANALVSGYLAAVSGNLAYLTDDLFFGNLQIWDISDPSNPLLRSTPPLTVKKVQIVGGLAYVIDTSYPFGPQNGLWILDISDPAHPSIRGSYTRYEINGVAVPESGQRAYVDGDWFQILDLTNPISPSLRGSHIDPNDTGLNRLRTPLYIAGTHVYASNVHWPFNTLLSFDVTNPDAPALSSSTTLTGTIAAITGMNNLIYVLSYTQYFVPSQWSYYTYLTILDISDPSNPIILGRINELTYSHYQPPGAITLAGTLAYLATGDTLDIIDVGDPAHPQVRTHYDTPGHASDVQIIGDLAYVADAEAGLSILDISDRLKPTIHGRYIGSPGFNVFTKDGLAYLNTGDMILLVDLHELSRPVPRASYSRVRGQFQVVGDLIYVAGGSQGLQILRIHPDRFPSPAFLPLVRR